jgi:hypothetical protein
MKSFQAEAAAWAAPLFALQQTASHGTKQTHKLPQTPCVVWLPDYRAYLRSLDLFTATFKTSPNAEGAMRLGEEQACVVAQDLIDVTGVRVHVRAFHLAGEGDHASH